MEMELQYLFRWQIVLLGIWLVIEAIHELVCSIRYVFIIDK